MNPTMRAAAWMTGSIASFSAMAVAGRELGPAHDTFEIMMYRSVVGFLIVMGIIVATGRWRDMRTERLGTHLVRNVAHFIGQNLWFFAVAVIPLAQVFALEFTTPIWVIVLSPFILGEAITRVKVVSAAIGFSGILLVARPDVQGITPEIVTAAASAIFFAITIMLTKRLTRDDSILSILFYLTATQVVMGMATAGYDGSIALPTAATLPWLVLVGLCGLTAHFCLTNALALAPATIVVPIDFIRLPAIAVIGMLLYDEALSIWVFVGALLIFSGNYLNILAQTRATHS